eukprot:TRINITY_DN10506_c0_g1_i2.p3 TRINITY_DN10506_c0_g1~~TRINITY_DN10506_c0_g1_i2.p3  ORF type:complete len:136 (-),score=18.58 TRINITY_DN10506_c0_g1_i2:908-1315(-)
MENNQLVAIKQIKNVFKSLQEAKRILREIVLLDKMKNINIINLLDIFPGNNDYSEIYLVMEFYPSDLQKLFKSSFYLTKGHIKLIAFNILKGIEYLHKVGILHRDLKPANILVNEDCEIKICDFGLARSLADSSI